MLLDAYIDDCRALVLREIRGFMPRRSEPDEHADLYDLALDYPLREAKGLRPFLSIATCRALGGPLDAVLPSAAVLELYHNAFLVHDDIEDGSELRRGAPTLHQAHGVPIAINVGDAMFALTLRPLLDNIGVIGLGPALSVLRAVADMTVVTVEGQALELGWIRQGRWDLHESQYVRMVEKKTAHYTFIAPVRIGAVCAGRATPEQIAELTEFARALGVAFQIHDDVLNLLQDRGGYGKEFAGDLWEGKRTLMLLHALAAAAPDERARAIEVLRKPRPCKTEAEVAELLQLIRRHGSLEYARRVAAAWGEQARERFVACCSFLPPSTHRDVLGELVDFVQLRTR